MSLIIIPDLRLFIAKNSAPLRLFDKPKNGRVAVKVNNHLGDEVMKVFRG